MNYIKIFQNSQALSVSVGGNYSDNHNIHIFLDNFQQGIKYSSHIAIHQVDLRREEKFIRQNLYLFHLYSLII